MYLYCIIESNHGIIYIRQRTTTPTRKVIYLLRKAVPSSDILPPVATHKALLMQGFSSFQILLNDKLQELYRIKFFVPSHLVEFVSFPLWQIREVYVYFFHVDSNSHTVVLYDLLCIVCKNLTYYWSLQPDTLRSPSLNAICLICSSGKARTLEMQALV